LEGKMQQNQTERGEAARAMHRLLAGGWIAQIIHTAAELGLADHIGEEAKDMASLASATATHPPSLSRLLRALAAIGIVHETQDGRYTLTPLGATLRTDKTGSMRAWARFVLGDEMAGTWRALLHTVRTGDSGFRHAFGTDQRSYQATHPEFATLFNTAMLSGTQALTPRSARITRLAISAGSSTWVAALEPCCCRSWSVTPRRGARSWSFLTSPRKRASASPPPALPPAAMRWMATGAPRSRSARTHTS
jgi:hypothetical protein